MKRTWVAAVRITLEDDDIENLDDLDVISYIEEGVTDSFDVISEEVNVEVINVVEQGDDEEIVVVYDPPEKITAESNNPDTGFENEPLTYNRLPS